MGLSEVIGDRWTQVGRGWHIVGWAMVSLLAVCAPAARANTTVFTDNRTCSVVWPTYCSPLSNFGLLIGTSADLLTINSNGTSAGWAFNGGIGVGTTSGLSSTGSANVANSIVDFADAVSPGTGNCGTIGTGTNFCTNGGTWDGGQLPIRDQTLVGNAESALDNILARLATYTTGTALGTSGTLNVETGGGVKVYRNTGTYTQSGALTFGCGGTTCNANDLVIISLTGTSATFNYNINLADGLTSDQLIFYFPTNGSTLSISPTAAATLVKGTFFVNAGTVTVGGTGGNADPVTLYGRIYNNNGNVTFNNKGGSQDDDGYIIGPAPEPGTWALMIGGLGLVVFGAWRKRSTG